MSATTVSDALFGNLCNYALVDFLPVYLACELFIDGFTLFLAAEVAESSLSMDSAAVALVRYTTYLFCFWWRGRCHSRWCLPLMGLSITAWHII